MGFVDNVAFKNARETFSFLFSFEVGRGRQCFLVGFRKVSLKLPKGCGLQVLGPALLFL